MPLVYKTASVFVASAALKRAVAAADRNQTALGFPYNLIQSQLSGILRGRPFGPGVRARIEQLGASLGLSPGACARRLSRTEYLAWKASRRALEARR